MKILIVNSVSLEKSIAEQTVDFLSKISGVWEFRIGEPEKRVSKKHVGDTVSWESLFYRLQNYREQFQIPADVFILLLTNERNSKNWFGMADIDGRPQGFVQTSYWSDYVYSESIYPILYEIVAIPLQSRMFKSMEEISKYTHFKPIGCLNDFCSNKSEIILKLQTANICTQCYQRLEQKGVGDAEMDHVDKILDTIRLRFREFNIRRSRRQPFPIRIENNGRKIQIGDITLKLSPIQRSLYLFFLKLRKQIRTTDLDEYADDIIRIYQNYYNRSSRDEMISIASRLAKNEDSLATQTISKINAVIDKNIIPEQANYYKIITDAEGYKSIMIKPEQT